MTSIFRRFLVSMLSLIVFGTQIWGGWALESLEGRFSFSLSTFDPTGKLGQVERALLASTLGTPIVAVVRGQHVLLAAPQILPSPLMQDDGTSRFAAITPHIAVGHSGISADGRALVTAAQRLAVEHMYLYDEAIPIDLLLEELSLLYQEYTMKPATRPFGATLVVAYVPPENQSEDEKETPRLFRLDPSGAVVSLDDSFAIINGPQFSSPEFESALKDLAKNGVDKASLVTGEEEPETIVEERFVLSRLLQEAISTKATRPATSSSKSSDSTELIKTALPSAIIAASLTRSSGLATQRKKLTTMPSPPP